MSSHPSTPGERLEAELVLRESRASLSEGLARWTGYLLTLGAIILGFIAFVLGSRTGAQAYHVAVWAALAGLCGTINSAFNFNSRADSFCRRKNAYRRLLRTLHFPEGGTADIPSLAAVVSVLQESSAADFPSSELITFKPLTAPSR